jgi:hypothetical protein
VRPPLGLCHPLHCTCVPCDRIPLVCATLSRVRAAANVYLREPSRYAALFRFEDFLRDPVAQVKRVHGAAHTAWRRSLGAFVSEESAPATDDDAVVRARPIN